MSIGKKAGPAGMAVLGVIVAVSLIVVGIGYLATWQGQNTVQDPMQIGVETIDTSGFADTQFTGDHENWTTGTVYREAIYDAGIRLQSAESYSNVSVQVQIAKTDINTTDLTVWYWETVDSSWHPLIFTDMGDYIETSFGPSGGFPVSDGYDATTPILIQYHVNGQYDITLNAVSLA